MYESPSGYHFFGTPVKFEISSTVSSPAHGNELWGLTGPRPIRGDLNDDGKVFADYLWLNRQLIETGDGSLPNLAADFNVDNVLDNADLDILRDNFGKLKPAVPGSAFDVLHPQRVDLALERQPKLAGTRTTASLLRTVKLFLATMRRLWTTNQLR